MAYVLRPIDTPLLYIDDSDLAAYIAAGWTQASAPQIAAYHAADPYAGHQTAPPAPKLAKGVIPNVSTSTQHVH